MYLYRPAIIAAIGIAFSAAQGMPCTAAPQSDVNAARHTWIAKGDATGDSLACAQALAGAHMVWKAIQEEDANALLELTLPSLIRAMGGRKAFVATYRKGMDEARAEGVRIVSLVIGDSVQLRRRGGEAYAVIPTVITMSVPKSTKVVVESYLLGFSPDGGRSWTYVNGSDKFSTEAQFRQLLPRLPKSLRLPAQKEPVVTRE
ncbi:MAG: hypothetical protein JST22_12280 [Bacteroidetes bacterium]|nr:hypothetical protein [Bacteroidota bacterium]